MSTGDTLDKLVVFLAKRDGIDKLVKTFQYVSKLAHWGAESSRPELAKRAKSWETASGLSRKAFRSGRFLTGFNALRRAPGEFGTLAVLANAGEMVYFFFDHFTWLSRVGVLEAWLARPACYVSAFGESVGYLFFIAMDFIMIRRGLRMERKLLREASGGSKDSNAGREKEVRKIRVDRVMRLMATAANVADLVIGIAEVEPNPFCNHAVTLGISGLVSAWAGWYRNWPS
ncbi:Peroxisomal membrane protein 11-4 [Dichanthelium oligosanthes]|uniref:Peroxisomal membrane protein 11-4 n=1 Tax=Dichanthelium oligosanthes TaxID=888268 RepID=A0A1E5W2A5_9POAL|nr:Peroxisomal membrane protein 11-4 [Dichanthelium oligosanthes]